MSSVKLESVQCVKDLGTIAANLKFSQQSKDDASKAYNVGIQKMTFFLQE